MVICIWGTVFLELWKRKNAVLAYEWDVHNFEDVEPDRPEYFGKGTQAEYRSVFSFNLQHFKHMRDCIYKAISTVVALKSFGFRYGFTDRSHY